ncbi:MAG: HupE/UreJ family protein [Gammaproteobacteria bacterium]|nr:HupE/UreJ family protein [Gammaproteobacteria bacterium]
MNPTWSLGFLVTSLAFWPLSTWAHANSAQAGDILSGLAHPASGLDHVLAMIAVGLWGAQLGLPALWILPVAFPMLMAVGGMLGLVGVQLPAVEIGIAVSAVILGALVVGQIRLPLPAAVTIVTFFAVFHGHAHGKELEPGQDALLYSLGFVMGTGLLHGIGIAIGSLQRWEEGGTILRATGGLIMTAGVYFLWDAL